MKRTGVVLIIILAFIGLADSSYLAQHEAAGAPLLCNINNLSGCNVVAASPYSHLFGIPLAEYGILFYGIVFVLAALELVVFDRLLRRMLQSISLVGVVASLYFTLVQVFLIGALCVYCLLSALIVFLMLVFAGLIEPVRTNKKQTPSDPPSPVVPHFSMPPTA
ncbi:vitamin K epoxide reductase family protein [Patescibacteria group bacterium]|nr:vitamin K epoxide reductase family protein [Patescibacteria group bacterium]MDE2021421.1 vitamin K epoxide reductase family protein [Patescibacteria group bacterium]MDE2173008.1 vitamin K epoxide reductase family protein [Patescibacteria group bacterium]